MTDRFQQPQLPPTDRTVIDTFRWEFGFLSNFHEASIWIDGVQFRSVEHAYQAAKASDPSARELIREAQTPGIAKKLGRAVQLPVDWDAQRIPLMRVLIREKFKNPLLRAMLLATGDAQLIHTNSWNDKFWGVCRGVGLNHLGRILMETRDDCKKQQAADDVQ